jgi:hypothetical protein
MLRFQLESRGDEMKHYQKIKERQRAYLGSMERKRDTARWRGDISQRRDNTSEGKGGRRRLLG